MRKTVAAATMAASLTIGGAAGVALFAPTISGAQTDDTTESTTDDATTERGQRLAEILAPLVEAGTIDQAQADAVIAAIHDAAPGRMGDARHGGFGLRGAIADEVSQVLGLSAEEIRSQLAAGSSLADIAADQGVETQAVVDAIVASIQERIDAAVADGRLTEDEAAERADDIAEHAADMVERSFDGMGAGFGEGDHGAGPGMGQHRMGARAGTTDS